MDISELSFLLVEDHPFQRRAMRRSLTELGAKRVVDVSGGREALDVFRDLTQPLDVIVSDIDMPDGDGMELLRHIGESGAPVSVILVSALHPTLIGSVERMATAYGVHVLGTVEKPLKRDAMRELLAKHTYGGLPSMRRCGTVPTVERREIEAAIAAAQFVPLFQPIVELPGGRVLAAEALVRWRHPARGWLSPGSFIDAVERFGLVDAMTWSVLDQAARACRDWRARGLDASVSVNLSAYSLADALTSERIVEIVDAAGIDARRVILEITESVAATDIGHTLENVTRLRLRGFEIAVDDFGTGYSSMQQIARIPFTKLKIDRSFVHGAPNDHRLQVLIDNAIRMSAQLGMSCVAEGVETPEEWALLARFGCDAAQGYFVAKPMAAVSLVDWAQTWSAPLVFERRVASQ